MTPRQKIEAEMVNELLARRNTLRANRAPLEDAAALIGRIDAELAVIAEELQAYGYVEPQVPHAQAVR